MPSSTTLSALILATDEIKLLKITKGEPLGSSCYAELAENAAEDDWKVNDQFIFVSPSTPFTIGSVQPTFSFNTAGLYEISIARRQRCGYWVPERITLVVNWPVDDLTSDKCLDYAESFEPYLAIASAI